MFCSSCGTKLPDDSNQCFVCGAYINSHQYSQPTYKQNNSYDNQYEMRHEYIQQYNQPMGMKWYKFIIYFMLFVTAIGNFIGGFIIMGGGHYVDDYGRNFSEQIYRLFGGLKFVDFLMGVICICIGVYALIVRAKLAEFRTNAPKMFLYLYGIDIITNLLYTFMVTMVTPLTIMEVLEVESLIGSIVMIVVNKIYFENRAHLFKY